MNIENIKKVRDRIEAFGKEGQSNRFDMRHIAEYIYYDTDDNYPEDGYPKDDDLPILAMKHGACNTSACICGWAIVMLATQEEYINNRKNDGGAFALAGDLLGLDYDQAEELFSPWDWQHLGGGAGGSKYPDAYSFRAATPAEAVKVLDHLMATGEVDWNKARASATIA
jgi:hypothetical protein